MPETTLDITIRLAEKRDRDESVELFRLSQQATGVPDPRFIPPDLLERRLYVDDSIVRRYVAEHMGMIVGHALVELPNPHHFPEWLGDTKLPSDRIMELGRAFVHPDYARRGIWTELLVERLCYIENIGKIAVAATWIQNDHVKRTFEMLGAEHVGDKPTFDGEVSLYRF